MTTIRLAAFAAAASVALASGASADELRIGFLNSESGPGALIGKHLRNGWDLGLEHHGWKKNGDKLGGVPTSIFYGDDQSAKVDVGLTTVDKFIKQDKVQVISGVIWSNVMMAIQKPAFDAKVMIVSANAGPSPLAGGACSKLFVSASFVNDGNAEATGIMATKDKIKTVVALAPNYQAGKDNVAGFERTFKGGKIVDKILFKVNQMDYQADLSKVRALNPQAVYIFAPGSMGVAFMKQWAASGLSKTIKLYSIYTVDAVTLPGIGEAGIGATEAGHWNPDLNNAMNKRFVKDYKAKFNMEPSYFDVQSYDAVGVIAQGVKAVGGKLGDMAAVARAIRKHGMDSPRGHIRFNVNGMLIQPYWRLNVVKGPGPIPVVKGAEKLMERPDAYWQKCPADRRI
ncbi:MAG: ABC transporter substrate-binding protein [Rhodospirillaceae bacterium]|nr:ABC transporter substrate-binding protein [Rhodospirillaceae bacterium]